MYQGRSNKQPSGKDNCIDSIATEQHVRCLYTNIDGLNVCKGVELQTAIYKKQPDIIFLTETKLTEESVISQFLDCSGYTVFRQDWGKVGGGGVMILVKKSLCVTDNLDFKWEDVEVIPCRLRIGVSEIILVSVYRPSSASPDTNKKICQSLLQMCDVRT